MRVLQRRLDTMQAGDRRLNTKGLSVITNHSDPKVQFVLIHSERKPMPKIVANFFRLIAHKEYDRVTNMVPRKLQVCAYVHCTRGCQSTSRARSYFVVPVHNVYFVKYIFPRNRTSSDLS